jgi:hypothetical protein
VHIQKDPPFWDVFPPDDKVYELVLLARVLGILNVEFNKSSKEDTIRYQCQTSTGLEKVEIASNWEEAVQILSIDTCRRDKEAIQEQVENVFFAAESNEAKQALTDRFDVFLKERERELAGGSDDPAYRRDREIVKKTIVKYGLPSMNVEEGVIVQPEIPQPPKSLPPDKTGAEATPAPASSTASAQGSNVMTELKKLAEMYKDGLLDEDEFKLAKKQLLEGS